MKMNAIIILLGESKLSATIEILFLLIVAGVIGYITAWLYQKSTYSVRIKVIESEKNKLNKELRSAESENDKLQNALLEKDIEIKSLKLSDKEASRNLELVRSGTNKTRKLNHEKDESLAIISTKKTT